MKRSPCIVIGLDAFDPALARRWMDEGRLPNLAQLAKASASVPVENPFGLFVGALWVNFASAMRPDRHGFHCWEEVDVDTYEWRLKAPDPSRYQSFWRQIGNAGLKVVAIDVPHGQAAAGQGNVEIVEWGCHDRHFGLHSDPPDRALRIAERYGFHPILGIAAFEERAFAPDDYVHRRGRYRTPREERLLLDGLRAGVATKTRMIADLLAEEQPDLLIAVFGESHAIGHQQWHLHDDEHPRFDPQVRDALGGDPILSVYQEIDKGVGSLLAKVGPDATVLALLSHGMGPHYDGTHLLEEILTRIDRSWDEMPASAGPPLLRRTLPWLQDAAKALKVPQPIVGAAGKLLRSRAPAARSAQRFYLSPNNFVFGGVRINMIGREPEGKVAPEEYRKVCERLSRDLLDIVDEASGRPIIRGIEHCDDHHRRTSRDTFPDLLIDWERIRGIEAVTSPRIGRVAGRYVNWRTGDHRADGLLLVRAPDTAATSHLPALKVEDIGPSLAARLGVRLEDADGVAVPWLSGQASGSRSSGVDASVS